MLEAEATIAALEHERPGGARARRRRGRDAADPPRARAHALTVYLGRRSGRRRGAGFAAAAGRSLATRPSSGRSTTGGRPHYREVADATANGADDVVLAAAGIVAEPSAIEQAAGARPRRRAAELIADATVLGLHARRALGRLARPRAAAGRGGEEPRARSSGSGRSSGSTARGVLVALGGGCTTDAAGLRGGDLPPRDRVDRRADDARRPGRRGDRRQDRDQPPPGKEPRRRVPLAGVDGDRPGAARDAARAGAAGGNGRGGEDGPARRRAALGASRRRARPPLRRLQGRCLPARPARARASARSSTSGTRSRTRSRPPAATARSRTARRSRSGCSRRCGSPGSTRTPSSRRSRRSPCGSTATRAWAALARDKKARDGKPRLVLLEAPGEPRDGRRAAGGAGACGPRRADRGVESPRARGRPQRRQPRRPGAARPGALRRAHAEPARDRIYQWARELELLADCRQTNNEGEYVDWCHDALDWAGGVIVNPGAWTHYSYAIHDALEIFTVPVVEVHLSEHRASARSGGATRCSATSSAERVIGKGPEGYRDALVFLAERRCVSSRIDRLRATLEEPLLVSSAGERLLPDRLRELERGAARRAGARAALQRLPLRRGGPGARGRRVRRGRARPLRGAGGAALGPDRLRGRACSPTRRHAALHARRARARAAVRARRGAARGQGRGRAGDDPPRGGRSRARRSRRFAEERFIGRTERDLAWRLDTLFRELGGDGPAFESIVAGGPNGARPHSRPTDRPIGAGETIVIDAGAQVGGYNADCTRTFAAGLLPEQLQGGLRRLPRGPARRARRRAARA